MSITRRGAASVANGLSARPVRRSRAASMRSFDQPIDSWPVKDREGQQHRRPRRVSYENRQHGGKHGDRRARGWMARPDEETYHGSHPCVQRKGAGYRDCDGLISTGGAMTLLAAVRGVLPPHRYGHDEITAMFGSLLGDPVRARLMERLHDSARRAEPPPRAAAGRVPEAARLRRRERRVHRAARSSSAARRSAARCPTPGWRRATSTWCSQRRSPVSPRRRSRPASRTGSACVPT